MIDAFKASMITKFDMKDLGLMNYFLDLEVVQSIVGIFMSQKKYILETLSRFQMHECNAVCTPAFVDLKAKKGFKGEKDRFNSL